MDSISIASVTIDTYQTGKNNRLSAFSFPCDSLFPPFYRLLYFGKFKTTNPYLTSSSCPPLMIQQWGHILAPGTFTYPITINAINLRYAVVDNGSKIISISSADNGLSAMKVYAAESPVSVNLLVIGK